MNCIPQGLFLPLPSGTWVMNAETIEWVIPDRMKFFDQHCLG
jgi:hypothetical protein